MDLKTFLQANDFVQAVEIVAFENVPPQYVGLHVRGGMVMFVANEMVEFGDRKELGSLQFLEHLNGMNGSELREKFPGGRVSSCDYLIAPENDEIAGVRIDLEGKEMMITTGDAPYSIFVHFHGVTRGRPEYPLDRYRLQN